jgi:tRNA pseudouridine-54 N-methylase
MSSLPPGASIPPLNTIALGQLGVARSQTSIDDIAQLGERGLTIRLVPANGGIIISVRNENQLSSTSDLYVIGNHDDIGAELGKIITMHYLKS